MDAEEDFEKSLERFGDISLEKNPYLYSIVPMTVNEDTKRGSMESNLTGCCDHRFLTGLVLVGSHTPGISLCSKSLIFALTKSCPLFLFI